MQRVWEDPGISTEPTSSLAEAVAPSVRRSQSIASYGTAMARVGVVGGNVLATSRTAHSRSSTNSQ